MTLEEIKNYFGTFYRFRKNTGITYTSIYRWKNQGYINAQSQIRIQELTNGKLVARLEDAHPIVVHEKKRKAG